MPKANLHPFESERFAALNSYEILDTPPESAYDDIIQLACQICQVPVAAVSLVDQGRQWFKASRGIDASETPRDLAFCAHTILEPEMMSVPDATKDPRFADNPLVTEAMHVRFYLGATLTTPEGLPLGALCVLDVVPRQLTPEQEAAMGILGRQVMAHLNLRRAGLSVRRERDELRQLSEQLSRALYERDEALATLSTSQAVLVQASKMVALGEMAAGVAHEINNPLAVISGRLRQMNKLVSSTSTSTDAQRMKVLIASVEATTGRIAQIVRGLRTFSRSAESDPFKAESAATIVADCVGLCTDKFHEAGVKLTTSCAPADLLLECRATEICQVLLNLLTNALDAIEDLSDKWVDLTVKDAGDSVQFIITDSGAGIPVDIAVKLLQPFFTTKPVGKGTGLGLSISSGLCGMHKGSLAYDAAVANTCFVVTLPKRQHLAQEAA